MGKKAPRIRCLACNELVERKMISEKTGLPYCLIPLHFRNKHCCICSICVDYYYGINAANEIDVADNDTPYEDTSNTTSTSVTKSYESETEKLRSKYDVLDYSIDSLVKLVKRKVFGQDEIVERVIYTMYLNQMSNLFGESGEKPIKPKHLLLIGDTGVGKTLLATTAAKTFGVPYSISNATSITSAGYIGDKVENILERLYYAAGRDIELAQNGVVIIDEIDKKVATPEATGRDVAGRSVQQELLKLLEPSTVYIQIGKDYIPFSTENITIIMLGAFEGLNEIIKKRVKPTSIGFGANEEVDFQNEEILPDDLINYGFIPEFVGRCPIIKRLNRLSHDVIVDIIYDLLAKYNNFFKNKQFEFYVDPLLIENIAEVAIKSKTGARDLEGRIDELLQPALCKVFQSLPGGICDIREDGTIDLIYTKRFSSRDEIKMVSIPGNPLYATAEE